MLESARDDHDMPFNFVQPLLGIRIGIWMRIDPGNRCVCVCVCITCMRACCEGAPCMHAHARMHTCMHAHRARTSGSSAEVPSLTAGRGDYPPRPRGRRFGSPPLAGQLAILSSPKVGSKKIFFVFFVEFGINGKSKTSWIWLQNRSVWDEAASPGSLISMGT